MDCSLRRFSLPLATPLQTAAGTIDRREGFLVRLTTDEGQGLGEATPLPGWTESVADCATALESAAVRLPEAGVRDTLDAMAETPAARHGIALAEADRRARGSNQPLYRALGAERSIDAVPTNATIGDGSVAETTRAAEAARAAGFSCLKVKVGARELTTDRDRLAAVRRAVGEAVDLRIDANGAWDRETANRALDELAAVGIEYVEQPLPADDLDGLAALRGGPIPIAVDESLVGHAPSRLLERSVADRFILKPMVLGGLDRAVDVASAARATGVASTVTTTVDAVVGRTAAVHLAAALEEGTPAGLATASRLEADLGPDPAPVDAGRITVPQSPGHGVEVSEGAT